MQPNRQALRAGAATKYSTWNKYHSSVRFQATVAASGGGFSYTINAGTEMRAFSYGIGADLGPVGFPTPTPATAADTNLLKGGETNGGENVVIRGLSVYPESDSDALLCKILWPVLTVGISLNGDSNQFKIGTAAMAPGGCGLAGVGDSYLQTPPLGETYQARSGSMTNGVPHNTNRYEFPDPMIWNPSGQTDSSLIVKLRCERTVSWVVPADRAGAAGVAAWTHPAQGAIGSYVTVKVHLHSQQYGERSVNQ